ncbi:hypothetical protein KORDIASMS9_01247 [Kordia sp. SMS9]|uniref:hypothetical protein n=1 Tax=Kordia sp. SMS9 TaxID=2282170 RepID=UPI000E0DF1E0|nr:hypothetical protein [Kordia sp. SMS9]AXG69028.1 hypothetical protein KORDIASMS9_01247 [Kordia sp. SMS9]
MEKVIQYTLYLHIFVGTISLISGAIAIFSAKGKMWHRQSGKIYFYAMTAVFITGIVIAGYKMNRFLFLIAFLSYYSVFCGVRSLKLKKLHKTQSPKWYDWFAGILNTLANAVFLGLGLYYFLFDIVSTGGALLTVGFGIGGLAISYANLKPFVIRPKEAYHWYMAHIGNMMGGYIATFTAFLSTMVTRFDLMNPFLAFALPSLIGVPLLIFWQKKVEKSFQR